MTDAKFTVDRAAIDAFSQSEEFQRGLVKADDVAPFVPKIGRLIDDEELQRIAERRARNETALLATPSQCERHGPWQAYLRGTSGGVVALAQCPACATERRLTAALGRSGIPPRFQSLTLDAYLPKLDGERSALSFSTDYAKRFNVPDRAGHCMIFTGHFGTGKTHLACGIGLELIRRGHSVAHFTVMEIVRRWRESWAPDARMSERDVLRGFVEVDFLILEEIGRQKNSEAERSHLFEILDGRYGNNKPTLITSNYPLTGGVKSIEGFLGQAAFDRLYRNGCTVVEFDWESYTRRAKA